MARFKWKFFTSIFAGALVLLAISLLLHRKSNHTPSHPSVVSSKAVAQAASRVQLAGTGSPSDNLQLDQAPDLGKKPKKKSKKHPAQTDVMPDVIAADPAVSTANISPLLSADSTKKETDPIFVPMATIDDQAAHADAEVIESHKIKSAQLVTATIDPPKFVSDTIPAPKFVMSLCRDLDGDIWVGTEGEGIFRLNAATNTWDRFTAKDGLGDDFGYAVACDLLGRIWVGHLNHGVSVYNGKQWQNYEVVGGISSPNSLSGPLGERIFAIKVCPADGDVWMATSSGLARYSESQDAWAYYTRADGLPSDQAEAIAFDRNGDIYVGTQCDGIAIGRAADGYKSWHIVKVPENIPVAPDGKGLPTNLVNDLLVEGGIVYAATPAGLAWSRDKGTTWQFVRGQQSVAKVQAPAQRAPRGPAQQAKAFVAEDYVTALASDSLGNLYIGFREYGSTRIPAGPNGPLLPKSRYQHGYYATSMVCSPRLGSFAGTYGGGLVAIANSMRGEVEGESVSVRAMIPAFPSGAKPPDLTELNNRLHQIGAIAPLADPNGSPIVIPLNDDWLTEGDWLGRIGRYWALLAAMDDPYKGYVWGAGPEAVPYKVSIGPAARTTDYKRFWIAQFFTENRSALEIPPVYMDSRIKFKLTDWSRNRRQAEWDDHGETYPRYSPGPDLLTSVAVPRGTFFLSVYDVNDDAHETANGGIRNSYRDFDLYIDEQRPDVAGSAHLASDRVVNFYGGVYKRFLVKGPLNLTIRIARRGSFNTIINAVMLDLPDEKPVGYFMTADEWQASKAKATPSRSEQLQLYRTDPKAYQEQFEPRSSERETATVLLSKLDQLREFNPKIWAIQQKLVATELARWYVCKDIGTSNAVSRGEQATALYLTNLYSKWEECLAANGETTARQIEKSLRWDGITPDNSGRGYETIQEFLMSRKPMKLQN